MFVTFAKNKGSMSNQYAQDEQILEQIKNGDQKVVRRIYEKNRLSFRLFIMRYYGANEQDAQDVYPEAFTKFYYNIVDEKLQPPLKSSLKTYLFSIGKHVFHKRYFSKYNKSVELKEEVDDSYINPAVLDMYENESDTLLVSRLLDKVGDSCRKILTLMFIQGYDSESVQSELGLPTPGAVRKRKFDCLKKIRLLYAEVNF
jgi:RNA polymerase sigma factor (sigma-70 family)